MPISVAKDQLRVPDLVARNVVLNGVVWVVAYVALDYLSFVDSFHGLAITPWSPAAGLALALVVGGGARYAPVVLIAPALAGAFVRAGSVPAAIHALEGLLFGGVYLLAGLVARRFGKLDPRLLRVRDTVTLMLTSLGAAALTALGYVSLLRFTGFLEGREVLEGFFRLLVGELIGMLIVAPLVLLGVTRRLQSAATAEAPLQLLTIVLAFSAIFVVPHASEFQLFYLLFVPLLWWTFRAGIAGAAAALAVIQLGLILALHLRHGAMDELTSFQVLMISLSATGLVFGGVVEQQQATALRLRNQQLALSRALRLRSMGEIATAIAHEINQPITSIRTYAGIGKDALENDRPGQAVEAIGRIRSECDRASSIIRTTRDMLRQQVARPIPVATEQLLEETRELLLDRLAGIDWSVSVSPEAKTVIGDPAQLKQALYNIVDNGVDAIESSGRPGWIAISVGAAAAAPSQVEFAVRDSGPGLAPELSEVGIIPLLSTKPGGTGIGLAIARTVAEAHGGSLAIEREGETTVVRLRLASGLESR